ncbi:Flavin monooxygenase-like protein [Cordyceps fumosorosea ARSEF 2679]|uniref:Flavin monooxygenase-like protein n=1 Tax=Cordyceps fumosorosea (strain ARSEF 2679) TaxID=1081104 RepID=A0A162M9U6_CORFA|nr:Flavin monooxygenase-like protein [Cordyceps fumosorosea ARSEF 2679]OAA53080.1 Flavin monooxygenase-like protein [Cordyceps fumosorosea ARSEF 2679]
MTHRRAAILSQTSANLDFSTFNFVAFFSNIADMDQINKKLTTSLTDYSAAPRQHSGPYAPNLDIDALVVGAGFAGVFLLKTLRDAGLNTVVFEAGNDIGGTWRWNCYPGAGVDSEVPVYEFSWPEVYKTWNWTTNYPDYNELRQYFDHVDKVVGIKKDCSFNTVVVGAHFETGPGKWIVRTADGRTTRAKFLVLATGFASKRYVPEWPGIDKFKGTIHHSSFWPDEDAIDVRGKRCAIIGTGASGVQMTQAWGPVAGDLKVFQRTPNLTLPMRKRPLTAVEQDASKRHYRDLFSSREKNFGGFFYDMIDRGALEDSPEQREAVFEGLWADGGFRFWLGTYRDVFLNAEANKEAYKFWVKKTRERVADPKVRELLAPSEMPHYFGVKRPCLEDTYCEQFNRDSVHLVDIKNNPIREFTETGITLKDGTYHELDVIALATGFDIVTGTMTQLGLQSIDGGELEKEWASGAKSYLGMTVSGYPNMFYVYGAQAPTLLCNGPTSAELQGRWIAEAIAKMQATGVKYMNPKAEAAGSWRRRTAEVCGKSLFPTTKSTYMGGSIPGKVFEPMCFVGGTDVYAKEIRKALHDMEGGFDLAKDNGSKSML